MNLAAAMTESTSDPLAGHRPGLQGPRLGVDPAPDAGLPGLWIASVVSNVGTWMHDVGAAWLMTQTQSEPPPFLIVQLLVLTVFVVLGIRAVMRFYPWALAPVPPNGRIRS